jgi:hypothetical protein
LPDFLRNIIIGVSLSIAFPRILRFHLGKSPYLLKLPP